VFVVRQGDTLWSIAASLAGESAGAARVAAMVDQLWRLNSARIRSGSPHVIQPGEKLLLPGDPG
jgi:LysM repeat protein